MPNQATTPKVAIVMPAYNEADGITGFLTDIVDAFTDWTLQVVVVDDSSKDGTADVIDAWASERQAPVTVVRSTPNAGHGPSTLKALRSGLAADPDLVLAVDGDGQFEAADMVQLAGIARLGGVDIVEGVRTERNSPLFRQVTSFATRTLVSARAHARPKDANTPLRVYRPEVLRRLLDEVPADAMTPNLFISVISRRRRLRIIEVPVRALDRRGDSAEGTTWGQRRRSLPTRRFVNFCVDAAREWITWRG